MMMGQLNGERNHACMQEQAFIWFVDVVNAFECHVRLFVSFHGVK
jgi:hypothetical protein